MFLDDLLPRRSFALPLAISAMLACPSVIDDALSAALSQTEPEPESETAEDATPAIVRPRLSNHPIYDMRGNPVGGLHDHLRSYGDPVLVAFGGYWCIPCQYEVPALDWFHQRYGSKLRVVGIYSFEKDDREDLRETKKLLDSTTFPAYLMDGGDVFQALQHLLATDRISLPRTFLVNANMEVLYVATLGIGVHHAANDALEKQVQDLLALPAR